MTAKEIFYSIISYSNEDLLKSGVYKIYLKNRPNLCYVGSTTKNLTNSKRKDNAGFKYRWLSHLRQIINKNHYNKRLMYTVYKYGIENIQFEILEFCKPEDCIEREQYWINTLDSFENGYNLAPFALVGKYSIGISKPNLYRPVDIYNKNGELVKEAKSLQEAAEFLNQVYIISDVINNPNRRVSKHFLVDKGFPLIMKPNMQHKKVIEYDRNGEFIKIWDNIQEAADKNNIKNYIVSSCCKNKAFPMKYNKTWRYWEENYPLKIKIKRKTLSIECGGNLFNSLTDFCKFYNLKLTNIIDKTRERGDKKEFFLKKENLAFKILN